MADHPGGTSDIVDRNVAAPVAPSDPTGRPARGFDRDPIRWARGGVALAVLLLCLVVFFRDALATGLTRLYGDGYDGGIEVAILDHWYRVFVHGAPWDVTGYFHPYPATLGYNDTYLIPGIPFVMARIAGADPFVAAFASHVAMKALGFAGMYVLLRRGLFVRTWLALGGAAVFATANASLLHMYHAQLLSVGLFPWLGFLALRGVAALRADRPRAVMAYGGAFALLYGATAFSAFYGLWFFSLFLAIQLPLAWILAGGGERRALLAAIRRQWRPVLACALLGAVALVPVLMLYLPKIDAGARHPWLNGPHLYLPDIATLFNVGPGNLVWGWIPRTAGDGMALPGGEDRFGLPVGLMAATLFAMLWAGRERAKAGVILPIGIAIAIILALALRWPGDHTAWWYLYAYVPGASAIRVVARLLLFALVGVIPIVIVFLDRAPRRGAVTALILAGLLAEQVQLDAPLALDRDAMLDMLAVGAPPRDCTAFFVVSARPAGYPLIAEAQAIDRAWGGDGNSRDAGRYRHNVDAMLLASYYGRPTINGISSFNPPDWHLSMPDAPDYLRRVQAYAARHRVEGLCGLDVRRAAPWFMPARGPWHRSPATAHRTPVHYGG